MYEELEKILVDYKKRIEKLEKALTFATLVFPSDGRLGVPQYTTDPASPEDGDVWYNQTLDKYRGRENGVTKTFDTT